MIDLARLVAFCRSHYHIAMLSALVGMLLAYPAFTDSHVSRLLFNLLFDVFLLMAIVIVRKHRLALTTSVALGVPALAAYLLAFCFPAVWPFNTLGLDAIRFFLMSGFFAAVALFTLGDVVRSERVTIDKLCGAVSVYVMIGIIGGLLFASLDLWSPGAFDFAREPATRDERFSAFVYYSFVTLTTLGFGDMVPVSSIARTITYVEAMVGQVYLTVLVARLVSLHVAERRPQLDRS